MLRIISANLNGIRSAAKKGFMEWMQKQQADFICVQELKAQNIDFLFRSLDMSELNLEIINKNSQFEYEYEMNYTLSPNNAARIYLRERIDRKSTRLNSSHT